MGTTLATDLAGFVRFIMLSSGHNFFQVVGELELSLTQVKALHLLAETSPELSLKDLGDRLGLSLPAVSRAVDGLVQRGLVTRTEDDEDRRMKRVAITDAGSALVGRLIELRIAGIEDFVATLSDAERTKLAEALAPIVAREDVAAACRGLR